MELSAFRSFIKFHIIFINKELALSRIKSPQAKTDIIFKHAYK